MRINVAGPAGDSRRRSACSRRRASDLGDVSGFTSIPTNDAWCATTGRSLSCATPTAAPQRAIIDWEYNAWGGKYPPFDLDNAMPARIAAEFGEPRFAPGIVLEGGSIDVNGRGTLLTTEQCLLNPEPQPASRPQRDRAASARLSRRRARSSGWATASSATTPTATSTTWPASSIRTRCVTVVEDGSGGREPRAAAGEPRAAARRCGTRTASRSTS